MQNKKSKKTATGEQPKTKVTCAEVLKLVRQLDEEERRALYRITHQDFLHLFGIS